MARLARVVVPGVPHHVTQRGNRRQDTFFADADYAAFRAHERTGRPLGDDTLTESLEARLGRALKRRRPGPKAKTARAAVSETADRRTRHSRPTRTGTR